MPTAQMDTTKLIQSTIPEAAEESEAEEVKEKAEHTREEQVKINGAIPTTA